MYAVAGGITNINATVIIHKARIKPTQNELIQRKQTKITLDV
jgi:hypothetical protein